MKCSFLDWFESSRRPKGCAARVLNPLIFSRCVEFPCHLVEVLVGWIQTTGFAYAAPSVVIMDNSGIIFSKRFHLLYMYCIQNITQTDIKYNSLNSYRLRRYCWCMLNADLKGKQTLLCLYNGAKRCCGVGLQPQSRHLITAWKVFTRHRWAGAFTTLHLSLDIPAELPTAAQFPVCVVSL